MKHLLIACFTVLVAACGAVSDDQGTSQDALEAQKMGGIHWARDVGQAHTSGSPNLIYHGGPVMTQGAYVEPIFWGTSWGNASFVGDKMTGLQTFYGGMGGSAYDATNSEYTDG